jgi:hypothetical protein
VIVRGGEARYSKDDRTVYLDKDGAIELLRKALGTYRREHENYPARVVLHKTSKFTQGELEGLMLVLAEKEIDRYDFVNLDSSFTRLFRVGDYPPVRGTWLELEEAVCLLYATGSVPYYETYQGKYPPRTLKLNRQAGQLSLKQLAQETLALTKMNWNSTDFDELFPITLRAARQVGSILKYLEEVSDDDIKQFYRFYM